MKYDKRLIVRPFLKWAGGKSSLLPEILSRLPDSYGTHYEPFLGGGALALAVLSLDPDKGAVLGDLNAQLVNCWNTVKSCPMGISWNLGYMDAFDPDADYYLAIRAAYNCAGEELSQAQAARFIWLNKHCFNGLYRVNKEGWFNVPWNRRTKSIVSASKDLLHDVSRLLKRADVNHAHWRVTTALASPGDFVYLDPPYWPVSPTKAFTAYGAGGFGKTDQKDLVKAARELDARGVAVMLSNNDVPEVRELYEGFRIESVPVPRPIQAKGTDRKSRELIIRNY